MTKRTIPRWEFGGDTKSRPNNYIYNIIYWKVGSPSALPASCCCSEIPRRLRAKGRGEIRQINWLQMSQKKGNVTQEQNDLYKTISSIDYMHFSAAVDTAAPSNIYSITLEIIQKRREDGRSYL
jgi:hypothetical protein